jgi:TRAP-type C4-dicarboxylate transport system permease small subunit
MFGRALALLRTNLSIVVPGCAVALVLALVQTALEPADPLDDDLLHRSLRAIAQVLATIVSIAYTTGMADVAWQRGRATFADGARAFRRDGGHVFVAMLVLFALGFLAAVLAAFSFGLSLLVYAFFCIYTMASAVAGERPGLRAVAESAEIAFGRPLPTLGVVLGIGAVAFAMGFLATLLANTPFVGPLLADVVVQIVVAYAALVIVGEYRLLRGIGVPV